MPIKMRHQERAQQIGIIILGCVAAAGFVAAAVAMPSIAALAKFFPKQSDWERRQHTTRAMRRLLHRGLIEECRRGRTVGFRLTDRGRERLARHELAHANTPHAKKWDGKWRFVIFDIPERRRYLRDHLRAHFQRLGLNPIQKSVWLFPHPCQDIVNLLKVNLGLGRNVQYLTAESFEDREEEKSWRLHFDV